MSLHLQGLIVQGLVFHSTLIKMMHINLHNWDMCAKLLHQVFHVALEVLVHVNQHIHA
jgi:hypothetical protein